MKVKSVIKSELDRLSIKIEKLNEKLRLASSQQEVQIQIAIKNANSELSSLRRLLNETK